MWLLSFLPPAQPAQAHVQPLSSCMELAWRTTTWLLSLRPHAPPAQAHVQLLLSRMEMALEDDHLAHQNGQPAVHKFALLKEVR